MRDLINKLQQRKNLTRSEVQAVMQEIMSGRASEADMHDFLVFMNDKIATVEEITGAAQVMRKFVLPVETDRKVVLDTCGTGGDGKHSFNISTTVAFVVAAAGVAVAKHGNRSVSSKCGSADVLESLGVKIDLTHDKLSQCLKEVGIAFLFAQRHHPAMKHVAPVRKALGATTIFNVLGPLTNPARATHQMLGVYNNRLVDQLTHVLSNLGSKRAVVVHSADGMDEVSTANKTFVGELKDGEVTAYDIEPEDFGFKRVSEGNFIGGDKDANAKTLRGILEGEKGPRRDIVVLNAAFALYAAEAVKTPQDGIPKAAELIDSGASLRVLKNLIEFTNRA
jgi:anthranilate phosphoribosyltransferase